jgi:hypothetical protein
MEIILPPQNNLRQDSEGNEENRYPVSDSNKAKKNDVKEQMVTTSTTSKKKSCK